MKTKIGQYARFNDGSIIPINDYLDLEESVNDKAKVADTPQELILEKDLVETLLDDGVFEVEGFTGGGRLILKGSRITCPIECTKIMTPNADKSVYTEQWKKVK